MTKITELVASKVIKQTSPNYMHTTQLRREITKVRFTNKEAYEIISDLERKHYLKTDRSYAFINRRKIK